MKEVETAKYRIIGLVDFFDEQGIIKGQLPIGSIQVLPIEIGIQAVNDGRAEAVAEEGDEAKKSADPSEQTTGMGQLNPSTTPAPEADNDSATGASGEYGASGGKGDDASGGQGKVE